MNNKLAYDQYEEDINARIKDGHQEPFAVVVCDINNLKIVNDTCGHNEGDICIKNASSRLDSIYSHSPVFRVGGDEFVVILAKEDYVQRDKLLEKINAIPKNLTKVKAGETVSAGMAEYDKGRHQTLLSIAEEADKAMYERKQYLKKTIFQEFENSREEN